MTSMRFDKRFNSYFLASALMIQIDCFFLCLSFLFSKLGGECKLPSVSRSGSPYIGHHVGFVAVEIAIIYVVGNQRISMYDGFLCAVYVPGRTSGEK